MGCFLVPAAEAIVTTAATKIMEKKEKVEKERICNPEHEGMEVPEVRVRIPFSRKIKWLSNLLWGGASLLAFEHVWHGEVVPWFPFLTAADNPQTLLEMFQEMETAGVSMALLVTGVWGLMVLVTAFMEKKETKTNEILHTEEIR